MVSRSLKFKLVALLIASAALAMAMACGGDEPARTDARHRRRRA